MAWGFRVDRVAAFDEGGNQYLDLFLDGDVPVAQMTEPAFERLVAASESRDDYIRRVREAAPKAPSPEPEPELAAEPAPEPEVAPEPEPEPTAQEPAE